MSLDLDVQQSSSNLKHHATHVVETLNERIAKCDALQVARQSHVLEALIETTTERDTLQRLCSVTFSRF